jgi:hypothetical protein
VDRAVPVDARGPALVIHDSPLDHDGPDAPSIGGVDERADEIVVGHPFRRLQIVQREVGLLADLDGSGCVVPQHGAGPVQGRHLAARSTGQRPAVAAGRAGAYDAL